MHFRVRRDWKRRAKARGLVEETHESADETDATEADEGNDNR